MIKKGFIALLLAVTITGQLQAQEEEITDEQLRRYALLTEVIDLMKKDISVEVNKMIKNQEGMTGKRYVELSKTKGDEAKLTELNTTDFEKQFLALVDNLKTERTDAIKSVNSSVATKMIGNKGKTYKAIKAALKEDPAIKERFDTILAQLRTHPQANE